MKKIKYISLVLAIFLLFSGCKKFLETKPDVKLAVPTTLVDYQALLDNYNVINSNDVAAGEVSADNYYLATSDYLALTQDQDRNTYTWQKNNLFVPQVNDWVGVYPPVFTSNTVLDNIGNIGATAVNQSDINNIKGQAFFIRGAAFLQVATLWAPPYDDATASGDLGIALRLSSDFNIPSVRSNVQQTYSQIISDLKTAANLLPLIPVHVMRPSKPAAFALLARTYLAMRNYKQCALYADSCLQSNHTLLDYNTLNSASTYSIPQFNAEVIRESKIPVPVILGNTIARIDSNLYLSYASNDLRKTIFFKSIGVSHFFRGSYEGGGNLFSGIATDELYLMRAECFARAGDTNSAISDLNTLLIKRWKTGTFVPLTAATPNDALTLVLIERRKELLMRGLRWIDLRRLNKDGANIVLTRIVNNQSFALAPNDLRYTLPIPDDIIQLTGMPQNQR